MSKLFFILLVCVGVSLNAYCQLNVQLLHQLVAESKREYANQTEAKNKQTAATVNEGINQSKMEALKSKYRQLQNRFRLVGTALNALQIGIEAYSITDKIIQHQIVIFNLAKDHPMLTGLAFEAEKDLVEKSHSLIRYLIGLSLSVGDINQMKASDRKMLFEFALAELRVIENISRGLSVTMMYAGRIKSTNPFRTFISQDAKLANDILRKFKALKN